MPLDIKDPTIFPTWRVNYQRLAPAIRKGKVQVVDLDGGSWNHEHDGDIETWSLDSSGRQSILLYVPC